jgi:hypothetical protein
MNEVSFPLTISRCHDRIRKLEQELDELKFEIEQAHSGLTSKKVEAMRAYGLTPSQAVIFVALSAHTGSAVSVQRILSALEADNPDARPDGSLSVQLHRMRFKLAPHGFSISNKSGLGYALKNIPPSEYKVDSIKPKGYWVKDLSAFLAHTRHAFKVADMARFVGCHPSVARSFLLFREAKGEVGRSYKGGRVEWHKCNT